MVRARGGEGKVAAAGGGPAQESGKYDNTIEPFTRLTRQFGLQVLGNKVAKLPQNGEFWDVWKFCGFRMPQFDKFS